MWYMVNENFKTVIILKTIPYMYYIIQLYDYMNIVYIAYYSLLRQVRSYYSIMQLMNVYLETCVLYFLPLTILPERKKTFSIQHSIQVFWYIGVYLLNNDNLFVCDLIVILLQIYVLKSMNIVDCIDKLRTSHDIVSVIL